MQQSKLCKRYATQMIFEDLDSISSAIAYAWFASKTINKPCVALVQTPRRDLKLRPENVYTLSLASFTPELEELLCIDDIPLSSSSSPFPSNKFALVDHNRLGAIFAEFNPAASVVAVIDHHEDEGLYTGSADPRIIQVPTGSCTSLVTIHMVKTAGVDVKIPPELATLLLCGIFIDTTGLKVDGKAVETDHEAAAFLIPRSTLMVSREFAFSTISGGELATSQPVKMLTLELSEKKASVEHLTTNELLRRDYKQYSFIYSGKSEDRDVIVGLAAAPISLERWISRDASEFWKGVDEFIDEYGLDVLGILTSFSTRTRFTSVVEIDGKRRQIMFVVREPDTSGLQERLWAGIDSATEFGFDQRPFEEFTGDSVPGGGVGERRARAYEQGDIMKSRKAIAPLVKHIFEDKPVVLDACVGSNRPFVLYEWYSMMKACFWSHIPYHS